MTSHISSRGALLLAASLVMAACGTRSAIAPDDVIPFALPADAPRDAAAAPGTTRVTVTMIQITREGDSPISSYPPDRLVRGERYRVRSWVYCPAGLEGLVESQAWQTFLGSTGVSSRTVRMSPGYNYYDDSLSYDVGVFPNLILAYRFELHRDNVVIASREIVITIS